MQPRMKRHPQWLSRMHGGHLDVAVRLLPVWIPPGDRSGSSLLGPRAHASLVVVRDVIAWWLHRACELSSPMVGALLGGRHHTTVLSACARVERDLLRDGPRAPILFAVIGEAVRNGS